MYEYVCVASNLLYIECARAATLQVRESALTQTFNETGCEEGENAEHEEPEVEADSMPPLNTLSLAVNSFFIQYFLLKFKSV